MPGYTDEKDAGNLLTKGEFGAAELEGILGGQLDFIVERDPKRANGHLEPRDRSAIGLDGVATFRFLDMNSAIAYNATAANAKFTVQTGAGNTGTVTFGAMKPGTTKHVFEKGVGGMPVDQIFELEGVMTYTISV